MANGSVQDMLQQYFPQHFEPIKPLPKAGGSTSDIVKLLNQVIQRYQPGGEFGKAEMALLGREKKKSIAGGQSRLTGAGLAGTTLGAGLGSKFEEEVGMPAKLRLEDVRTQRLTEALGAKAGYLQSAEQQNYQAALAEQQMKQQQLAAQQGLTWSGSAGGTTQPAGEEAADEFNRRMRGGSSGSVGGGSVPLGGGYTGGMGDSYAGGGGGGGGWNPPAGYTWQPGGEGGVIGKWVPPRTPTAPGSTIEAPGAAGAPGVSPAGGRVTAYNYGKRAAAEAGVRWAQA